MLEKHAKRKRSDALAEAEETAVFYANPPRQDLQVVQTFDNPNCGTCQQPTPSK
jgi:hypothetical protein